MGNRAELEAIASATQKIREEHGPEVAERFEALQLRHLDFLDFLDPHLTESAKTPEFGVKVADLMLGYGQAHRELDRAQQAASAPAIETREEALEVELGAFTQSAAWRARRDEILKFCNPRDGDHWRKALCALSREAAVAALASRTAPAVVDKERTLELFRAAQVVIAGWRANNEVVTQIAIGRLDNAVANSAYLFKETL